MSINNPVAALSRGFLAGLRLSNDSTTPDELVGVSAGFCRDSTGLYTLEILNATTVSNVVSGIGGIDTGSVAASTLYSVYIIGDSSGSKGVGLILSTVHTGAITFPTGYDIFRRLGCVRTDGTSDNFLFFQTGNGNDRTMMYDSGTLGLTTVGIAIPSSATAASQTLVSIGVLTTLIPQVALEVLVYTSLTPNAAGDSVSLTAFGAVAGLTGYACNEEGNVAAQLLRVPCGLNTVMQVMYATSSATATVAFRCAGYIDEL